MTDDEMMPIPAEFWRSLTNDEFLRVMRAGKLDRRLCKRVAKLSRWTGPIPNSMAIYFRRDDIERMITERRLH